MSENSIQGGWVQSDARSSRFERGDAQSDVRGAPFMLLGLDLAVSPASFDLMARHCRVWVSNVNLHLQAGVLT
uniref:Uncharacterized protein n=1 Tax=Arundo donax TaxID=35708 RepID=A0A0A9G5H6_ARUDO